VGRTARATLLQNEEVGETLDKATDYKIIKVLQGMERSSYGQLCSEKNCLL